MRVLAVEDSPTQAAQLRDALEAGGYAVTEARSGESALAALVRDPVDVVVSDIVMPGTVDGYELCRRVKRHRPTLPVVLLTSLSDPLDVIRGLEAGADNFLTKPYAPEQLLERLSLLLATRRDRERSQAAGGVSVRFLGQRFTIESEREQILDLLVTTFEDAVRQNRELRRREELIARQSNDLKRALADLERAQRELIEKERLATLGRLSSSMGHELRNPLGVMNNAVYYLQAVLPDTPGTVPEYLGILRTQIHIAEQIVSDLLDFAFPSPPRRSIVDLHGLVDEQVKRVVIPPNIRLELCLPGDLPSIRVDPVQIGKVLLNLLINAVQAMGADGGTLRLSAEAADGRVLVSVEDTGPGVVPELREKIFEPLFTTKARGIGLGLSISRLLARANGGELTLVAGVDGGAKFVLEVAADLLE